MKRILLSALSLLLVCALNSLPVCAAESAPQPPFGSELVSDAAAYLECNGYVLHLLENSGTQLLPSEIPTRAEASYRYSYSCALLGDPMFSIRLVLDFAEASTYDEEKQRICQVLDSDISSVDAAVYLAGGTAEDIAGLMDDEIYDGISYSFEILRWDDESLQLEYYVSRLQDSHTPDPELTLLLESFISQSAA